MPADINQLPPPPPIAGPEANVSGEVEPEEDDEANVSGEIQP
jgi:hypothetical protein